MDIQTMIDTLDLGPRRSPQTFDRLVRRSSLCLVVMPWLRDSSAYPGAKHDPAKEYIGSDNAESSSSLCYYNVESAAQPHLWTEDA